MELRDIRHDCPRLIELLKQGLCKNAFERTITIAPYMKAIGSDSDPWGICQFGDIKIDISKIEHDAFYVLVNRDYITKKSSGYCLTEDFVKNIRIRGVLG